MREKQDSNTLLALLTAMRKHFFRMILIFFSIVLLVTIITFVQPPVYEIVSSVMVKYGREYVYRPVDPVKNGNERHLFSFNGDVVINTELEIYRSRELASQVLQSLGVKKIFPRLATSEDDPKKVLPLAVKRFKKQLNIFHVKGSNVIGVAFQHKNPEIAVQAVNLLTDLFKERHLQIFKNPQSPFLENQVSLQRKQLQEAETLLKTYKQQNRIFSLDEQMKNLMGQYTYISGLLIEEQGKEVALTQKTAALTAQLANVPDVIEQFAESSQLNNIDAAKSSLLQLKIKENDLLVKFPDTSRQVTAVRASIKLVKDFISNQDSSVQKNVRAGKNPIFQHLTQELVLARVDQAAQKEKNASLKGKLDLITKRLQLLSDKESQLKELQFKVETNRKIYKNFTSKLEDSRVQDAMDQEKMVNVVVIERPTIPAKPIKPRKKLNILIGIILGAACSLFYALFKEYVLEPKTKP